MTRSPMTPWSLLASLLLGACGPAESAWREGLSAPPPAWCSVGVAARVLPGGQVFTDLQDALQATPDSARVEVCPGVHVGEFSKPQRGTRLDIVGVTGDPADVVLDGDHAFAVLDVGMQMDTRLRALTVRNGLDSPATSNAGVLIHADAGGSVLIEDCVIEDNEGPAGEAGMRLTAAAVTVRRTVVRRNTGYSGAGLHVTIAGGSGLTMEDVTLEDNTVSFGRSPGLRLNYDQVGPAFGLPRVVNRFDRVQVIRNHGGAAVFDLAPPDGGQDLILRDSLFRENDGAYDGALSVSGWASSDLMRVRLDEVWFEDNTGGRSSGLALSAPQYGRNTVPARLWMTGGGFLRNTVDTALVNARPATVWWFRSWLMGFRDVDFGAGADANFGSDLPLCRTDYGPGTTGFVDTSTVPLCPSWPPPPPP